MKPILIAFALMYHAASGPQFWLGPYPTRQACEAMRHNLPARDRARSWCMRVVVVDHL
jgi:hypothetical protein